MRSRRLRSQVSFTAAIALAVASVASPVSAQEGDVGVFTDADEAARQSSNPLGGDFFIFLNQIDNMFLNGDLADKTQNVNVWYTQPVLPFPMKDLIGENWIFVTRPTFPFVMNAEGPDFPDGSGLSPGGGPPVIPEDGPPIPRRGLKFDDESGFGDITWFSLLGQSLPTDAAGGGDLVWGLGPTFQFPTASTDALGSAKYAAGPSAVGAFIGRKFILGGLFQHWESFEGGGDGLGKDVSFSWLNLFYFINLNDGWQVGGTPVLLADWESDGTDERFTIPIGLGVYKTHFFGKLPAKLGIEAQYVPLQPDSYGQEFLIRFVIAPIIPSPFGTIGKD